MKPFISLLSIFLLLVSVANSQSKLDSMMALIESPKKDTSYFKNLYNLGIEFERKHTQKAVYYFLKNIEESDSKRPTLWTALAKIRLAGVYSSMGEKDSAMHYFDLAGKYVDQHPDQLRARHQYFTGLGIHQNRFGQYYEALASYAEVEKVDIEVLGKMNLAGNYLNISNVYRKLGMVEEDFEALFKSLAIFEEIQHPMGLSYCYNSLAVLYNDQKDYPKAEEYFLKSYELRIAQEDKRGEAVVLGNLGTVFMDTERLQEAVEAFRKASDINEAFGLKDLWANMQTNLGIVYLKMNQHDSAIYFLERALNLMLSHNEQANTARILTEKGRAFKMKKDFAMAEKFLKAALEKTFEHDDAKTRKIAYKELSGLYTDKKDFSAALSYSHLFYQLKDSLESLDLKAKFQTLEAKYAFDKKETEINLLKTEKELAQLEIDRQYARQFGILLILLLVIVIAFLIVNRYRLLNRTKRLLEIQRMRLNIAQDLHDDIGSTLSSIQIISKVAQRQDTAHKEVSLEKIEHQATLMMDKLGDIVWSLKAASDNMEDLVAKMKEFASELLEPLNITIEFEGMDLLVEQNMDLEKRKNLYLIYKEALNNAAKYSQCTNIKVSFIPNGHPNTFQLIISDNGLGFDTQQISKGNGLSHIKDRAQKIKGHLEINSEMAKGTQVILDLASHD